MSSAVFCGLENKPGVKISPTATRRGCAHGFGRSSCPSSRNNFSRLSWNIWHRSRSSLERMRPFWTPSRKGGRAGLFKKAEQERESPSTIFSIHGKERNLAQRTQRAQRRQRTQEH